MTEGQVVGEEMSAPQERADQEVVDNNGGGQVEGIDQTLTPLQFHYLSLLQRLIAVKNSYQTDPNFETWIMAAINKAIYSALRDSIESNIGDAAKELLRRQHQVN
jgi:hypothetical protein